MDKMVTHKQVVKTQTQTLIHMKVVYLCIYSMSSIGIIMIEEGIP